MVKWQKDNCTRGSQAVSHPSTNLTQRCLTSVIGRELVFSTWYGRCREMRWKLGNLLSSAPSCWLKKIENTCYLPKLLKDNCTRGSQAVSHPSTDKAQRCLTSVIGRELVFSAWYGRWQEVRLCVRFKTHENVTISMCCEVWNPEKRKNPWVRLDLSLKT